MLLFVYTTHLSCNEVSNLSFVCPFSIIEVWLANNCSPARREELDGSIRFVRIKLEHARATCS